MKIKKKAVEYDPTSEKTKQTWNEDEFYLWVLEYLINFLWNTRYPPPTLVAVGFEI